MRIVAFERRDFQPEDLKLLQLRPEDVEQERNLELAAAYPKLGPAASLWFEEQLYACGGMIIYCQGSAELWCFTDQRAARHPLAMLVAVGAWIAAQQDYHHLDRLQARCRADWATANHFLKRLGFTLEATMRKHGPHGKDYCLWARVR